MDGYMFFKPLAVVDKYPNMICYCPLANQKDECFQGWKKCCSAVFPVSVIPSDTPLESMIQKLRTGDVRKSELMRLRILPYIIDKSKRACPSEPFEPATRQSFHDLQSNIRTEVFLSRQNYRCTVLILMTHENESCKSCQQLHESCWGECCKGGRGRRGAGNWRVLQVLTWARELWTKIIGRVHLSKSQRTNMEAFGCEQRKQFLVISKNNKSFMWNLLFRGITLWQELFVGDLVKISGVKADVSKA